MATIAPATTRTPDLTDQERLDRAMASYVSTPAKQAIMRRVLDLYEATGNAEIAAASITYWPSS